MSKIKFVKHPRSIVRKRHDHPSSLFVTIPKKIVKEWNLKAGQIVKFSTLAEGVDVFLKVRKV
jgi:antidote-toxin recognition MazE-like antitoxin